MIGCSPPRRLNLLQVVRAIEKRPKLLFLVRLAPYPYNLMNTLLASSPTLTLRTYTLCTALALPKLLVHCALGTSIKNFAAYNGAGVNQNKGQGGSVGNKVNGTTDADPMLGNGLPEEDATASHTAETIKHVFGFVGLGLCIGIFIYLFSVARKAVDEELDDDEDMDEYDMVLSDDDDDDEEEEGEGEARSDDSDLDHDNLNIGGRGSSENAFDGSGSSPSHQRSAQTHRNTKSTTPFDRLNGRESTIVEGFGGPKGNTTVVTPTLSHLPRKIGRGSDGVTPSFTTTARSYNDGNPYFSHNVYPNSTTNSTNRHLESQVSLADSIVEMEKHAIEMEQEPLFQHSQIQGKYEPSPSYPSYQGSQEKQ
jgi:hypothetical protein